MAALSYAITASLKGGDIRTLLKERIMDPLGIPERAWSIGYGRAYEVDGMQLYANWGGGKLYGAGGCAGRAVADAGRAMERPRAGQTRGREAGDHYAGMPKPARIRPIRRPPRASRGM